MPCLVSRFVLEGTCVLGQLIHCRPLVVRCQDFARLREEALQKTEALQKSAEPVLKVIENPEVADRLKGAVDKQRNMELLQKEYNVRSRV